MDREVVKILLKAVLAGLPNFVPLPGIAALQPLVDLVDLHDNAALERKIDEILQNGEEFTRILEGMNHITVDDSFKHSLAEAVKGALDGAQAGQEANTVLKLLHHYPDADFREVLLATMALLSQELKAAIRQGLRIQLEEGLANELREILGECTAANREMKTPHVIKCFIGKPNSVLGQCVRKRLTPGQMQELQEDLVRIIEKQGYCGHFITSIYEHELVQCAQRVSFFRGEAVVTERSLMLAVFGQETAYRSATIRHWEKNAANAIETIRQCLLDLPRRKPTET
ncbi:hypothetical protein [Megalodesulfovibrio gigas]|uniref:hypothetical protein n=1 Tax=Megalodesulfovibrio gigas TaxID=879 RepID=UPI000481DC8F|nr:hypothetical protein [Megalodesulfovibrio gigas]